MTQSRFHVRALIKSIKPIFMRNRGLKAFSLACAIGLYAFVHGAQDAQRIMSIDLVALLPPASENRTLSTDLPLTVRVSLHGPRSIVGDLRASDLGNMQLDLRSGRSGQVSLEPSMLRVPGGVVVDSIEPSTLNITWDDVVQRNVQIQVPVTGTPAQGYELQGSATSSPSHLTVRGARQAVDNLHIVNLESFDISGLTEGVHKRSLAITRVPSRVAFDIANATAYVTIIRRQEKRLFSKIPVQVIGVPRATVRPSTVDVRLVGDPSHVSELREEQIIPRVTITPEMAKNDKGRTVALPVEFSLDNLQITIVPNRVVVKW